ncbi:unnamed protein product [Mycena citricolor]|uniref:NACHT domain-containing protein n=1 Tax=Mycena citricolor TaxID=2018698 RepID=A0AAD2GWU2_9AGAR|nr:unnamed protein product [Mycena citricolor]
MSRSPEATTQSPTTQNPRKRPRSDSAQSEAHEHENTISIGYFTLEFIRAYHTVLRTLNLELDSLSNPADFSSLLFPSLLKSTVPSLDKERNVYSYRHVGTRTVRIVYDSFQRLERQTSSVLPLVGTLGCGKTHLLAVLASFLFTKGMPIIFLPHADTLEHDSLHWLKLAFALAFADIEGAVERIAGLQSLNDLILFSRNNSKQLYFLVDGFDLVADDLKATIYSLVSNHFLVYTTYQLAGRISLSIRLPSKFSEQDAWKWMEHYENDFPSSMTMQNRLFLKYITGGIPAHLQAMREFRGQAFKEIVSKFRQCHKMQALADDVTAFHSRMESLKSADRKRYLQLVTACLTDTIPEIRHGSHPTLYDPRYFCFDDEGRGCCASGLARDIMINLLYAEDMSLFTSDSWYSSVRSACGLIRDSSIVQICLSRIALSGLFHADANGTAMRISTFRETPAFGWMFEEARKNPRGTSSFLCIPGPDTCRFFTAVIVRINPVDKTACCE